MATWTTGYLEFHEEPYAPSAKPILPPPVRCSECDESFDDRDTLQSHLFRAHPIARPVLSLYGRMCTDATMLVSSATDPSDWDVLNCRSAAIDDAPVAVEDLGRELSKRSGVVVVQLDSGRAERRYVFDIDVPTTADLHGVDSELARLLDGGNLHVGTINSFVDRCARFRTASRYTGGIADYLYWRAWRVGDVVPGSRARYEDKLNQSAHVLAGFDCPAARTIVGLISFHFNHFDEAAVYALSSRLRGVSQRLASAYRSRPVLASAIPTELSPAEQALVDPQTRRMIDFCALPLDGTASAEVDLYEGDLANLDALDQLKVVLVAANHHIANNDPRAVRLIQTAGWHGLPEAWVDSHLDMLTNKGTTCPNNLTFRDNVTTKPGLQTCSPAADTATREPTV